MTSNGHPSNGTHVRLAVAHSSGGQMEDEAHRALAAESSNGHFPPEAHSSSAVAQPLGGHINPVTHEVGAAESCNGHPRSETHGHSRHGAGEGWAVLRMLAQQYFDAQQARIACTNRMERGPVDAATYAPQVEAMATAEKEWGKAMRKTYRQVVPPEIVAWQKATLGVGEHLLARLLGTIGHPRLTVPHRWEGAGADRVLHEGEPFERRVSDLWQYCGHGDPERKRRKGQTPEQAAASGNPDAKMLVRLIAEACMKQMRSPYRPVYDAARLKYADREGWTPLHQHNAALRKVGKEFLKALWIVAGQSSPEIHYGPAGHIPVETQTRAAGQSYTETHSHGAGHSVPETQRPPAGRSPAETQDPVAGNGQPPPAQPSDLPLPRPETSVLVVAP